MLDGKLSEPELQTCTFEGCENVLPRNWWGYIEPNPIVPASTPQNQIREIRSAVEDIRGELCWHHLREAMNLLLAWRKGEITHEMVDADPVG